MTDIRERDEADEAGGSDDSAARSVTLSDSPVGEADDDGPQDFGAAAPAPATAQENGRASAEGSGEPFVLVVEPLLPQRIRRTSDALRFLATLLSLGAVILLALVAKQTLNGLERDVADGTSRAPDLLIGVAAFLAGTAVLAVPAAFAVERVFHRDGLRVAEGLIAAIVGMLVSFVLGEWLAVAGPDDLRLLLTGNRDVEPINTLLTSVVAYVTAVRLSRRPTWRGLMWAAIALDVFALFTGAEATALGVIVTYLVGLAVGFATLYAVGSPNTRPPGGAVMGALRRLGLVPAHARRIADDAQGSRRYGVMLTDGRRFDVTVLDRDRQVAGVLYRLWRRMRLNSETRRRAIRSLRAELEREALMAYAAQAAGVCTPRLVATSEIGTEAALLAYEHLETRQLADIPDDELDDRLLVRIWRQVELLQAQRLAHRRLTGDSIHIDAEGGVVLMDARSGEIAAGDLLLRLDVAQLLTYLALRVGPERSVACAAEVMPKRELAGALPLLQRIALTRGTRAEVAKDKELLPALREQILSLTPREHVEEVRLERFQPRTLVTIIASAFAAYFLLSQLSRVNLVEVVASARWGWGGVALAAAGLSYIAAALMLRGFVPEKLPLGRTVLAQFAGSFVKLVAPAAVSGVAINSRYLQKRGIAPGLAVASVGASQLVGLGSHVVLLLLFGYVTGTGAAPSMSPSRGLVIGLLSGAVVVLIVLAVPQLRRMITTRVRPLFSGVIPRLLDVLQSPRKIIEGFAGTLLLTLAFVVCLDACVRAFGGSLSFTAVAVVFLAGSAIGSAAPTPGGLGAVEASLSLGLTLSGLPGTVATSAVLLFRLLTFWLPVLPGWASFTWLQRHDQL
ncbi:lysylphosphatidylglycerol synthase transmembrane domain-containing protein [Sphaerisporangium sp. TRM90804]|uniref:lysylphosphatidylglycerol synthase transmembrane domain-containing protein n=1 Tax=Sphaerisporangium sp. TRM90804 TaxID=3031113 RepID=UPI002449D6DA|nr:lysylphosphatidylglycerol synthase transmembrane domain-containing protein [Sphaerisporangium sp. TRM90804]MDH2429441.1 lysylphosphatidylglycerol synthase transmembrane domain-containing protein [Sphaerisporangium sp. TRM90804]